jgi:hypothetical protein
VGTTIYGGDGGAATSATFGTTSASLQGDAYDQLIFYGNLRIRWINPADGKIMTIAGKLLVCLAKTKSVC